MPVHISKLTPLTFLERSAVVFADKPAVIYDDQKFTYAELRGRVHRLAGAFRRAGVQPGDRVAYLAPNIPPMLEAHYAVPLAGAILVAINIRLSSAEIAYILEHSEAKVLVIDAELTPVIASVAPDVKSVKKFVIIRDTVKESAIDGADYEEFLQMGEDQFDDYSLPDENDVISVNYTSGTTGRPKGVMYTHRGAYLNALGVAELMGMDCNSHYMWVVPMFHCNGWCYTWGVTAVGATHVCLRKTDPGKMFHVIQRDRVTNFCCAPTVLSTLLNHPSAREFRLDHPLRVCLGGAPPSPALIREAEHVGIDAAHIYGLTETYGPFTVCQWREEWNANPLAERAQIKAQQGVAHILSGTALRVVDGDMRDVPADGQTLGEVVMRGNIVMKGYFKDPAATETAFRGGWFHSGDLAVMHATGYIEIRDRKKDIIISGGENISTQEVEKAICEHPDVMECAVIAVPHEKWGEVPKAYVSLRPGRNTGEREIIEFCRQKLAHFKCPQAVVFGPLPKTSTGKVKKFEIREKEWAGREKRVN
ncbi:MAG: long-chain-fatty-acid--CoA ligase [Acidobacteria bacterium]|nr:long-chain-fatty-acid--CoA ligase [Acidobacteriota bacterium]